MRDFTIELTTHKKIHEVNNDMCHNYYYVQHGRIYNADRTCFRRFRFILWFDINDICEYFDTDVATKQEISQYVTECGISHCDNRQHLIKSFNEYHAFYDWCNETIKHYNGC